VSVASLSGLRAGALLFALLAGCGHKEPAATTDSQSDSTPSSAFSWVPIRLANEGTAEEFPARVLATGDSQAVIVPPLPARVVQLLAKPGDSVEKGAAIAKVVMPEADAAIAVVNAADTSLVVLNRRRAQLVSLEADGLVKASDKAALDLDIARLTGEKIRAESTLRGAGVNAGGIVTLRSSVAGIVTEMRATPGELRRPEDGPIARVRSRGGQRIEATFPFVPAATATYTFRSEGAMPTALRLVNSAPNVVGGSFDAWFERASEDGASWLSQGRIAIVGAAAADMRIVSASAVGSSGTERFIVVRSRTAKQGVRVVVQIVSLVSNDAVLRGAISDATLVASDPYRAELEIKGGKPNEVPK
jgi:membrane fusion protein, heavy metal efflux system